MSNTSEDPRTTDAVEVIGAGIDDMPHEEEDEEDSEEEEQDHDMLDEEDKEDVEQEEQDPVKSGRFRKGEKFRSPYTLIEESNMIKYLLEQGGYKDKGPPPRVWKAMEKENICPGRSWQSMKARWVDYTSQNLHDFKVTEDN